jgi:hypothetical protein
MSNIRKSDVKNHLSPKFRTEIHLVPAVSLPDATGNSSAESGADQPDSPGFAKDFLADHSTSGVALTAVKPSADPVSP